MRVLLLLAAVGLIVTPAVAQTSQDGGASKATAAAGKNDPNRVVCRSIESTGSRLRKERQCMTLGEWAVLNAQNRRDLDRGQANRRLDSN